MANIQHTIPRRLKMADRAQQLLDLHFPGIPEIWLWHPLRNVGFVTIPRTLPIAMQAVDAQSKRQPAGQTLFCLWARAWNYPVLSIADPLTLAAEVGFTGECAVDTWRRRMSRLRDLNFIRTKPGPSGQFHHVLLLNPNAAMEWMRSNGLVQDELYVRFVECLADIGALDETEPIRQLGAQQPVPMACNSQTKSGQAR
ncbi:hypothetical protein [Burkholderia cepacia]|uniref:hypothetical protein n=1 Tax=Burkholderia cepacia TaxID=292 RepID=UPI001591B9AD|nr:hypothetical protein [Burkholderia cepacia]